MARKRGLRTWKDRKEKRFEEEKCFEKESTGGTWCTVAVMLTRRGKVYLSTCPPGSYRSHQ